MSVPCRYLLVDDNPTDLLLAQEAFEELQPDCTLTCVQSGEEALNFLHSTPTLPDVILLDINMPGMSGFQLLGLLKQEPKLRRIPVVMLSTSAAAKDISEAYSLHASSYMVKSSAFDTFLRQIDAFLKYWQANRVCNETPGEITPEGHREL
ncbi:response regulator [Deinococcus deserti]|uniref:Putative Response regulator, CheY n=1 Tax=Deinococcus deserti (strain DSM 17065 / CIP 109153 / LMG 22923 / VCD115) TaxID=546414 RepID=C1D3Y3_DEIDV|nr:response regulator [Deinococcus deserti]ACO48212.1 putative Response regulator, CheY [Deinococcus deserti VCD115]